MTAAPGLTRFSVQNPECNKIRSRVGERTLGWISSQFTPHCHSEARKVNRAFVSLESADGFASSANFCKACSFRHNHLHAPFLALVSDGGNDKYPRISAKLDVNRQLPTNGLPSMKRAHIDCLRGSPAGLGW